MRFCIFIFLSILLSSHVHGQSSVADGVAISADSMDRDSEKKVIRLKGNVQISFQGQTIRCDSAVFVQKKSLIEASGNVILTKDNVRIEGKKILFNYKSNTGTIYDGFVQSGQVVFEGSLIEKSGPDTYIATNGQFTACTTCPPAWSFSGRRIEAELGGYARISRPIFRVGGFPILILPGLIVPLKSARQSGLLVPSASRTQSGGWAPALSAFWAIDRSQDFTLTTTHYELRGPKAVGDYRYVLSDTSKGRLTSGFIQDRQFAEAPKSFTRWFLNYDHHFEMPEDYVHRINLKSVSDLKYLRDFPDEVSGLGDPAIENKMSVTKNTEDIHFSAEVDVYRNLLKTHALSNNDDAVHRFPEIRYSLKDTQVGGEWGPWLRLDTNYVKFSRDKYSYDDLNLTGGERLPIGNENLGPNGEILRDGTFDPNSDLVRTGQRLDIQPSLSYPFQVAKKFDILPLLRFRETQYRFDTPRDIADNFSQTAARRYLETSIAIKTEMNRVYGDLANPKGLRWKHSIEPEVGYYRIPWIRQPDHGFFGENGALPYARINEPISNADVNSNDRKLQFDYNDRTYNKNILQFSLNNTFTRKLWLFDDFQYRTVATFRLSQSYDVFESSTPKPQPWSPILGLLNARFDNFETYTTVTYNPYARATNTSSRVRYFTSDISFMQVSYTRNILVTDENQQIPDSQTENIGLGAGLSTKYFGFAGSLDYSNITYRIRSWKYDLQIRPPGRCWLISLTHEQSLGSQDAKFSGNVAFDFGGNDEKTKK